MTTDFVSNEEIVQKARQNLVQGAWDYLVGGSESETTMRRNRLAFDRVAFRPRVLVDVSEIDPSTTFLGHNLRIPVMLAPIGSLQVFTPGGGADATKAAAEFGTMPRRQLRHRAHLGGDRSRRPQPQGIPAICPWRLGMDRRYRGPGQGSQVRRLLRHCRRGPLQPSRAPHDQPVGHSHPPASDQPLLPRCPRLGDRRPHPETGRHALHDQGHRRLRRCRHRRQHGSRRHLGVQPRAVASWMANWAPWTCCPKSWRQ